MLSGKKLRVWLAGVPSALQRSGTYTRGWMWPVRRRARFHFQENATRLGRAWRTCAGGERLGGLDRLRQPLLAVHKAGDLLC